MQTNDIHIANLLIYYSLLLFPILIFLYYKINQVKDIILSALRMTIQLSLVGVFLKYIFRWNNPFLNIGWIILMLLITNYTVLHRTDLSIKKFFLSTLTGLVSGTFIIVLSFLFVLIKPQPLLDARYLIPITGMILGNCLRGNIIGLEQFYSQIHQKESEYMTYLTLGASFKEAIHPFIKEALVKSLNPMIASIYTIGLVALPGMMTGQILGGTFPLTAIKYQIAIMLAILVSMSISVFINLNLSLKISFNEYHLLKDTTFRKQKGVRNGN